VQHPRRARALRVFAVRLCQAIREARHAHRVFEALHLPEFGPDGADELDKR
jgi:hypothetical protein